MLIVGAKKFPTNDLRYGGLLRKYSRENILFELAYTLHQDENNTIFIYLRSYNIVNGQWEMNDLSEHYTISNDKTDIDLL